MDFFFLNIKIDQNIILLTITIWLKSANIYLKVTSFNRPCLEVHAGFFRLLTENALARVQRVHAPADLWDITFPN